MKHKITQKVTPKQVVNAAKQVAPTMTDAISQSVKTLVDAGILIPVDDETKEPVKEEKGLINRTAEGLASKEMYQDADAFDLEDELLPSASYEIRNLDNKDNLTKQAISPIFYDSTGNILCLPSPFDIAIRDLKQNIVNLENNEVMAKAMKDDETVFYSTIGALNDAVHQTISTAYNESIINAVLSYLNTNVAFNFTMNNGEVLKGLRATLYNKVSDRNFLTPISSVIAGVQYADYYIVDAVERDHTIYNIVCAARSDVLNTIAKALSITASSVAFRGTNNLGNTYIDDRDYKMYCDMTGAELNAGEMTPSMLYFIQSSEYTSILYNMMPMIDALLWQEVSTIRYLESPKLFKKDERNFKNGPMFF